MIRGEVTATHIGGTLAVDKWDICLALFEITFEVDDTMQPDRCCLLLCVYRF
jgi:hypothetical protein